MSRGPQAKIDLPSGWWENLRVGYLRWDFRTLEEFCLAPPTISVRTLRNAHREGWMTEKSLDLLADKLGYYSRDDLLEVWTSPAVERRSLFLVPHAPTRYFTGREDLLAEIAATLRKDLRIAVLSGPPGIGKTQSALTFAYRERSTYRDVFWVVGDDASTLLSQYCAIARHLDLRQKAEAKQEAIREAVRLWFDHNSDWLLVFDNVADFTSLVQYLPRTPVGDVVITTRSDDVALAAPHRLGPLAASEGTALLVRWSGKQTVNPLDRKDAEALADELGNFPLALDQAGAFISATGATFRAYLDAFRAAPMRVLELNAASGRQYGATLSRVWELTVSHLNTPARRLLSTVAFCAPDSIPLTLLSACQEGEEEPLAFESAVGDLRRFSLVTLDSDRAAVSIHRLLRTMAYASMDAPDAVALLDSLTAATAGLLPESPNSEWHVFDALLPHAESAMAVAASVGLKTPAGVKLLEKRGGYLNVRGRYEEAYGVLTQALQIADELWPNGHPGTASVLNALGNSRYYQARFADAEAHYGRALALREELLDPLDPAIGTSLNNIATLYLYDGRYVEAGQMFERALRHRESVKGPTHPDVATTVCNLANLCHAQGRFVEAEEGYRRAFQIRNQPETYNSFMTGWILTNYAELKLDEDEPGTAQRLLLEAMEIFRNTIEMNHPYSLMARHNLAKAHRALGQTREAEQLFKEVISRRKKVSGDDHPDLGFSYLELGALYGSAARGPEGTDLMRKGCDVIQQALGPTHPRSLLAEIRLVLQLAANGQTDAARDLYTAVAPKIEAFAECSGSLHPDYEKFVSLSRAALEDPPDSAVSL